MSCYVKEHNTIFIASRRQNEIFRETIFVITENNDLFFEIYSFFVVQRYKQGTAQILLYTYAKPCLNIEDNNAADYVPCQTTKSFLPKIPTADRVKFSVHVSYNMTIIWFLIMHSDSVNFI